MRSSYGDTLLFVPHSTCGSPSSPHVMLSPNATNCVIEMRGVV